MPSPTRNRVRRSALPAFARLAFAVSTLALLPSLHAQLPISPAEHLQQLIVAQQAAVESADPAGILSSGRALAALALRLLADLQTAQHQPAAAATSLEQSLALDPEASSATNPTVPNPALQETRLALLTADLQANRPREAALVTRQLLQTSADTALLHIRIANAHHAADDLPGTLAELSRAMQLDASSASAHLALGIAFWELNEYQYNPDSLREFTAAQQGDPAAYLNNFNLGSILSQYGRYSDAQSFLEHAAAADPSSPDPWMEIGMNAYAQDRFSDARPALEKAVLLTGQDTGRNSFQIRRVYAVLSRIEAAEDHTAEADAFALKAEQVHAAMLRSTSTTPLSESTGLPATNTPTHAVPDTAPSPAQQQVAQQLLAIIANSLNDAGTALARTRDYAAALPLFRQAALANPSLSPVQRNLGLAAFHTGAYDEAIPAFSRALEQDPSDQLSGNYLNQARTLRGTIPPSASQP